VSAESAASCGITLHAAATPDKPALVLGDRVRTYAELDDRSNRLARALRRLGAGADRVVAVVLPNCIEFFEVAAAAAKLEARFLPVNWHLKRDELAYVLADSGARVVITDTSLASVVESAVTQAPDCRPLVVGAEYEAALAEGGEPERLESGASPSFVFYTSGTTARPKGVVHGRFTGEVARMSQDGQVALWSWTPDDVYLMAGPSYHAAHGGWASTALYIGATVVILPAWDAREWLRLVGRHRVTRSFLVPAHFIRILEIPDAERAGYDISSLRLIVHAAAPCPVAVKRRIIDVLAPAAIHELYGASEGGATRISPEEWLAHPGSVGKPWPGVEVRIVDDAGRQVGPGEQGLIYVTPMGTWKFHYHNDPEKTSSAWRDDAFTVGDIGYLDDEGYLYITDRASDMVLWGGVNIAPREVEEVLHTHPGVVDCAVFGVPDARDGEHLKAVVEARPDVTADDLAGHVRERLADYKVPREWELVDQLPRDPSGKVLKRLLRAR
jgi:acyl-CoA synthetase (AMP-forming)/AMP-acid ligase II